MLAMVSIVVGILDSPYFADVISSVTRATSRYLYGSPAERTFLCDALLLSTRKNVGNKMLCKKYNHYRRGNDVDCPCI